MLVPISLTYYTCMLLASSITRSSAPVEESEAFNLNYWVFYEHRFKLIRH